MQLPRLALVVAALVVLGSPLVAAECRRIVRPPAECVDGDPTCDLDATCDGLCIVADCAAGSETAPRIVHCVGDLAWNGLAFMKVGRRWKQSVGVCPFAERMMRCRANPDRGRCVRGRRRTCVVSVNGATGTPTRCKVSATRRVEQLGGESQTHFVIQLPERPYGRRGHPGHIAARLPRLAGVGTFTADDPETPLSISLGLLGTTVPTGIVRLARLDLTAVSQTPTIWIDEIHGVLEVAVDSSFTEPDALRLLVEF